MKQWASTADAGGAASLPPGGKSQAPLHMGGSRQGSRDVGMPTVKYVSDTVPPQKIQRLSAQLNVMAHHSSLEFNLRSGDRSAHSKLIHRPCSQPVRAGTERPVELISR